MEWRDCFNTQVRPCLCSSHFPPPQSETIVLHPPFRVELTCLCLSALVSSELSQPFLCPRALVPFASEVHQAVPSLNAHGAEFCTLQPRPDLLRLNAEVLALSPSE